MTYKPKSFEMRMHPPFRGGIAQQRTIAAPLGSLLAVKSLANFERGNPPVHLEIEDCELVASYNLLNGLSRTILVPGRPPVWTPLPTQAKISPDHGLYYRDENAARFPQYPMEPAARSIFHLNPNFDTSKIRIFACGSTLGDLLRFSLGKGEAFSFTVHKVGRTAFFTRRTVTPTERINNIVGFGQSFVEANTTWGPDVVGSASHQRVIQYQLGGILVLVRFEGDACILEDAEEWEVEDSDKNRLISRAAGWSMHHDGTLHPLDHRAAASVLPDGATVESRGKLVAQTSVFEIKTRASWKSREDIMAEQLPRLWVRQIHKFVLAMHQRGTFDYAEVVDINHCVQDWEKASNPAIASLVHLLNDICDNVSTTNGCALEIRGNSNTSLEFRELSAKESRQREALPSDLEQRWSK